MKKLLKVSLGALLLCGSTAMAQSDWPNRPVVMVVPFPPGGVVDTVARPVAEAMGRYLKQTVVVENKGGAGGGLGMAHVARATPDGYTILMALPSISIIPQADKIVGRSPMYQLSSLTPIARFTADPTVLAVRADSPWKTLDQFVAHARQKEVSFGSSGIYGTLHVFMEAFRAEADLKMLHIPYTGAGPSIAGLLGGQIDSMAVSPASVMQHVKSGRLRVLAHWGDEPLQVMPELTSLNDAGYAVQFAQWTGMFVPTGTPSAAIEKLRLAAKAAATDPKVRETIEKAGVPVKYLDTPEFRKYWEKDAAKLTLTVEKIGKVE